MRRYPHLHYHDQAVTSLSSDSAHGDKQLLALWLVKDPHPTFARLEVTGEIGPNADIVGRDVYEACEARRPRPASFAILPSRALSACQSK